MKRFHVVNIEWDTDGKRVRLPKEVTVECESEDGIADALSDEYGWLVNDYDIEGEASA